MTAIDPTRRAIGGDRVGAMFSMNIFKKSDEAVADGWFNGILVFNARGGCFFIEDGYKNYVRQRWFSGGKIANIPVMELTLDGKRVGLFKNLELKLLREKHNGKDCGIVVKFVFVNDSQLDKLNALVGELPVVHRDPISFNDKDEAA